jgi:hypothetical protein
MSDAPVNTAPAPQQGEAQEQGQPTNNAQAPKETQVQKEKRLLKAKIDGREETVDEETLLRHYQKERTADQKLREAAKMRKEMEAFYEALENDPESILNDPRLPIKKRDLAMKWLTEQIDEELKQVDPRDQELEEYRKKLEAYEKQEQEAKTKQEQEQYQAIVEKRKEAIATTLTKAMEMSPLSKDPETQAETLREMVLYMRLCRDAGYQVTPEELAQHVEKGRMKSYQSVANQLEGDDLINFLGEAIVNKIRKADLARLQKQREVPPPVQVEPDQWQPRGERRREFVDPHQLRRRH